jgi:Escherichia/Staphylococcus phage prohead protease
MAILSEEDKAAIRIHWQINRLAKILGVSPASADELRRQAKSLLTPIAQARGLHIAVGLGAKQLAGTVTTGEQQIAGYVSTWDEDLSGDICQPGCFDATLADLAARKQQTNARFLMPLLFGHDMSKPCGGVLSAVPDATGLFITCVVDTTTDVGQEAWAGVSHGYNAAFSIGYIAKKTAFDNMGRRLLLVVDLLESSIVPLPMNPLAVVTQLNY